MAFAEKVLKVASAAAAKAHKAKWKETGALAEEFNKDLSPLIQLA
jgi:hypothetical protein